MRVRQGYRLPADREALLHKAIRLEWISLGFVLSIVLVMYLSMGSSQTMKMALLEDLLALVPPVVFLLAMRMRKRPPDEQHPYGYSRAILGIIGIGLGFWWADAAAASIIAPDVLKDGSTHVRKAMFQLMDQRPTEIMSNTPLGLETLISRRLMREPDVLDVEARLREEGHLVGGEIFVVFDPQQQQLARRAQELIAVATELDWRLYDLILMPVEKINR